MSKFPRLNATAESILKFLADNVAKPETIMFAINCSDKKTFGTNMRFLLNEGYVKNCNSAHKDNVYSADDYAITVAGENYLSSLYLVAIKDNRQFWINIVNGTISLVALAKAFWNEISATVMQLGQ